ncbi:uncharacterized protein MEPE_03221 [Melanopsichium pennsylvanicum]|uniref:Transcription factor domain-containing protein n=2 Tax=Melanopsichium pennsylvanicum TaxID=63383 RepID=A0AAJ5C599_9BASI|nr:c6 transcription factor [Melanopsichium pennsylvanicum 4]SNX84512.1 uncharacterized protein MEPE_03221 [Melanopsichium pennsylvanicum]
MATSESAIADAERTAEIQTQIAALRNTIRTLESLLPNLPSSAPALPESTLRSLSPYHPRAHPVLSNSTRLIWSDVAHLFPPKQDVERILSYFLREMVYIMIPVQERQFWRAWEKLCRPQAPSSSSAYNSSSSHHDDEQPGISRSMVGSLLLCLASTSFLIPQRREEELGLSSSMAEQRDFWVTSALALVRSGTILSNPSSTTPASQGWLHYVDFLSDASLDWFGFQLLTVRIFALLGMSELAYLLNGECLRQAIRINLFDESSPKSIEHFTDDDSGLTSEEVVQVRRRMIAQLVVTETWSCLYSSRQPMIDDEVEMLPLPKRVGDMGSMFGWIETEELTFMFSRYASKLRLLPAQLTALTNRKAGDWATQRARDQEAVSRVLDIDRGLCALYDPSLPQASLGNRSHSQILAELPELLERNGQIGMSDKQLNQMHRDFAEALVLSSSWLSLRCLATSNLMFLPWVQDARQRYDALNLARRLIELLSGIWMMASNPYVPFSSSWISRHLFLACTVLSVPILGQEPAIPASNSARPPTDPRNPTDAGRGRYGDDTSPQNGTEAPCASQKRDFAPSRMQKQQFFSTLSSITSKHLDSSSSVPASSSVDLDWFSGKLVEIASLFSNLAERGDQTAGVNMKLIHALLNSRAELRDRVLDKLGQKRTGGVVIEVGGKSDRDLAADQEGGGGMGRIESQRDLTSFVMAASAGKSSPTSNNGASPVSVGSPVGYRAKGRGGGVTSISSGGSGGASRREVLSREKDARVSSPSLHDLANAVDTYTSTNNATTTRHTANGYQALPHQVNAASPAYLPQTFSPQLPHVSKTYPPPPPSSHHHPNYQEQTQNSDAYAVNHDQDPHYTSGGDGVKSGTTPNPGTDRGTAWDWNVNATLVDKNATPLPLVIAGGGTDILTNVPLLLDTQDWLAILDGVDIPL